jgi:hypothetical protein
VRGWSRAGFVFADGLGRTSTTKGTKEHEGNTIHNVSHHPSILKKSTLGNTKETSVVRNHPLDFGGVGIADQNGFAELAFTLLAFRSQDMAQVRVTALYLSGRGLLKALGSAFVSF